MKITQITPGLIPIPPNGWGATERVIWEYKLGLEKLGNICEIKYLNDVNNSDIVHIHMANLAIEASEKGIPYIFTLHDHHVVLYGKNSNVYKQNLEAMKKSVISFVPAEFLVDYFDECDKVFYLSHGVNTNFFKTNDFYRKEHKLLCIANNGYANNNSYDRKGFRYAIEAAKKLNLPITVAGPENNKNFFDSNSDLLEYDKLNIILKNLTDEEILKLYQEHSIFIHPSELEAGHPNLTLLEALSCSMPVVGTYGGSKKLDGMIVTNRETESIVTAIKEITSNYEYYVDKTKNIREKYDWINICKKLLQIYKNVVDIHKEYTTEITKNLYINTYNTTNKNLTERKHESVEIVSHFVGQPFLEIKGNSDKKYKIEYWDGLGNLHYVNTINSNMWIKLNREYYTKWNTKIYCDNTLIYNNNFNLEDKRVYIHLDSSSLGDTLAWFPMIEEFRKKHKCKIVCSTFHNYLFEKSYPDIEFIRPGMVVNDLYAMYRIGWFYNEDGAININKNPNNFRDQHLQKTASDILGLNFTDEIKPKIVFKPNNRPIEEKYFCIANHSTAQSKYWNNPNGWQDIVDYLKSKGYKTVLLSKEPDNYMGNKNPNGVIKLNNKTLHEIMNYIHHSEGFIGLGSGLSWLAWSLNKKVFLISGFSRPNCEMTDCERIFTPDPINICNGCFNDFRLDAGDWNWCPKFKGTERQFECTKSITSDMVIEKIKPFIEGL